MSEKSGYGGQIFILIIAIVLLASLSRVKSRPDSQQNKADQQEVVKLNSSDIDGLILVDNGSD